jgi:hypothetical protein
VTGGRSAGNASLSVESLNRVFSGFDLLAACIWLAVPEPTESRSLLDSDLTSHADLKSATSVHKNRARMSPFLLAL